MRFKNIQLSILAFLMLGFQINAVAQKVHQLINLKPGDKVPDITISNILKYKSTSAKLSDFRGKLLIIDFWATWCSPCRKMIPKMDSLQKQFEGKVQFLPVTYESQKTIETFVEQFKKFRYKDLNLPEVVADTSLIKLFPHNVYPHYAWIDGEGIVKLFTGMEEVTAKNIALFLANDIPNVKQKIDESTFAYDKQTTPLLNFLANNTSITIENTLSSYSILSKYIDGLGYGGMALENESDSSKTWRISFVNMSLTWLFAYANGEARQFYNENTRAHEMRNSKLFFDESPGVDQTELIKKITYCYELVVPPALYPHRWEILRSDMAKYFPQYESKIEVRERNCYALIRTTATDKLKSKNQMPKKNDEVDEMSRFGYEMKSLPISVFITTLNFAYFAASKDPVIDQTGYSGLMDISLKGDIGKLDVMNEQLAKYDLKIILKKAPVNMLVITDKMKSK